MATPPDKRRRHQDSGAISGRATRASWVSKLIGVQGPLIGLVVLCIDDEKRRRATLTQLNRGEGRHSLGRAVFHGKRGELRQRYREGQEDLFGLEA